MKLLHRLCVSILGICGAFAEAKESRGDEYRTELHYGANISADVRLQSHDGQGWHFQTDTGVELAVIEPIRWGRWSGIVGHQAVWMADGSWISCEVLGVDSDAVHLRHRWLDVTEVPLASVRAIVSSPAASLGEWLEILRQLETHSGQSDTVELRDGHRLVGVIDFASEDERPSTELQLRVASQSVSVPWTDVRFVAISPTLVGRATGSDGPLRLGLQDGSLLIVSKVDRRGSHFELETPLLGKLKSVSRSEEWLAAIRFIASEDATHPMRLDQIEPISYKFLPESEIEFPLGVNQSVFGERIVVGRRTQAGIVPHGLAIHSSAQVAFRWDGSPARFAAQVQLTDRAEGSKFGDAVCKVLLAKDGKLITATEFSLSHAEGQASSRSLGIDVSGAQLLVLVVEKGRLGQWGDEVYWLDARVVRP